MDKSKYILGRIRSIVKEKAPLAKVYLYGSRAQGKEKKDSDWDILILLQKKIITPEVESEITDPLYDLEFDTGEVISPMIYSEEEWKTKYSVTPFYRSIMQDCKLL